VTLIEFLRARLDEDERIALAAVGGLFRVQCDWSDTPVVEHIDRWTSSRVMAEVKAKRRIIAQHEGAHECPLDGDSCGWVDGDLRPHCETSALLALPYVNHPDYQREWLL